MYSLDSVMLEFDFLRTGETSVSDTVAGSGIGLDTWFPSALPDLVAAFPFLSSFVETPTGSLEAFVEVVCRCLLFICFDSSSLK